MLLLIMFFRTVKTCLSDDECYSSQCCDVSYVCRSRSYAKCINEGLSSMELFFLIFGGSILSVCLLGFLTVGCKVLKENS